MIREPQESSPRADGCRNDSGSPQQVKTIAFLSSSPGGRFNLEKWLLWRGVAEAAREHGFNLVYVAGEEFESAPQAVLYHINRAKFGQFMKHAQDWAQLAKHIPPQTLKNEAISLKSPIAAVVCSSYYFILRFLQLGYSWLSTGRFSFLLCFPGVVVNRLAFGWYLFRARYS